MTAAPTPDRTGPPVSGAGDDPMRDLSPTGKSLLVAGESFEDLIFAGLPRLPAPGEELRTGEFRRTFGGGALLAAAWARHAFTPARLLAGLPPGAEPVLASRGIVVRDLRRDGEPHAVTACLSFGADRSFATFPGVNPRIEERLLAALPDELDAAESTVGALLLALSPHRCREWTRFSHAVRDRTEVFWDFGHDDALPDRPGFAEMVESATGIFVNELESERYDRGGALSRASSAGVLVVMKRGARGAEVLGNPSLQAPARSGPIQVVDTTGAGDAFAAGFLSARLRATEAANASDHLRVQLAQGNRLGGLACGRLGGLPW